MCCEVPFCQWLKSDLNVRCHNYQNITWQITGGMTLRNFSKVK